MKPGSKPIRVIAVVLKEWSQFPIQVIRPEFQSQVILSRGLVPFRGVNTKIRSFEEDSESV